MLERVPLAVIGAGPAGLSAVAEARRHDLEVALFDEQPAAGGQIYRNAAAADAEITAILGPEYDCGRKLLPSGQDPELHEFYGASVWQISPEGEIYFSHDGAAGKVTAEHIILAPGAIERPMPIPGWTLPGVLAAGAGQTLLKASGLVPDGPVVLAGSGPLLWLLAAQYLRAGAEIAALVETTPASQYLSAARHLPGLVREGELLRQGMVLRRELKRRGLPHFKGASQLRAVGEEQVRAVRFNAGGEAREIPCDLLFLHMGVTPNVQITRALDLPHDWDRVQRCWRPRSGPGGGTVMPNLRLAGDGAGIVGAGAAALQGRLAALDVAQALDAADQEAHAAARVPAERELRRRLAARAYVDALFAPGGEFLDPEDETVVCRCEEVTAGEIRGFAGQGCRDSNQLKAFGRPGMGPCQGRMCGLTVAETLAAATGATVPEVGYFRLRWPVKPVPLAQLAVFREDEDDRTEI